jgi:hypothetical protein
LAACGARTGTASNQTDGALDQCATTIRRLSAADGGRLRTPREGSSVRAIFMARMIVQNARQTFGVLWATPRPCFCRPATPHRLMPDWHKLVLTGLDVFEEEVWDHLVELCVAEGVPTGVVLSLKPDEWRVLKGLNVERPDVPLQRTHHAGAGRCRLDMAGLPGLDQWRRRRSDG